MVLLQLDAITKTFFMRERSLTVLHDISLTVQKGEFLAITGQSGSGKSTLMNILGCLDVPTTGTYTIEGQDVSRLTPDELAHIRNRMVGFVFQQFNLLEDVTALDNVALPQLYKKIPEPQARQRAQEVLTAVGLADRMHHFPYQLSGGQQQRVSIARALVNKPDIILADEPTGNLDSTTGAQIMDMFIQLNKQEQVTVIIVTHDMTLANQTKRIVKLLDGRVVQDRPN